MAFNSDEVNLLVYRYLEESGFRHSAFTFGYESNVLNAGLDSTAIPRGALMSLLQKGVLFAEAEVFSLLNDGEIDARFEKAIGCMTILECVMCDSTKSKALQRKMAGTAKPVNNGPEEQQQRQRTPSRVGQQQMPATTVSMDHQQHPTSNNSLLHQPHGLNPSRPDSTSSTKSATTTFQQQQQSSRERDFRSQQSATSVANAANSSGANRGSTTYRPGTQTDRLGAGLNIETKCNPTLASTSAGPISITTSNHLHPSATNSSAMGLHHHPFYPQPTFGKHIGLPETSTAAYLAVNISNGGGTNGPASQQQSIQQQLAAAAHSTPGTFPHHQTLSNLHHQGLTGATGANPSATDLRMILNGGTSTQFLTAASNSASGGLGAKRGTGNG